MIDSLPATLVVAIRKVKEHHPGASHDELCDLLRRLGWSFDESAVRAHLNGVLERGLARRSLSDSANDTWRGIRLNLLPDEVRDAVDKELLPLKPVRQAVPPERRTSLGWHHNLASIKRALVAEIAATREELAEGRVRLRDGRLLGRSQRGFTARYETETDAVVTEGARVKLEYDAGATHDAEVLQLAGTTLTLWVEGTPRAPLPDAVLIVDASFLLGLRLKFLERLESAPAEFDAVAAMSVLRCGTGAIRQGDWTSNGALSPEQEEFVALALAGGTTWLWGPPGTGKTTTLAHLLAALVEQGRRVLFVSNTNAAVDTALERYLAVDHAREPGVVVRIGQPVLDWIEEHQGAVTVDAVAALMGVSAGQHLAECVREISRLRKRNRGLVSILREPLQARDRGLIGNSDSDRFELLQIIDAEGLEKEERANAHQLGILSERRKALEALIQEIKGLVVARAQLVFATVHRTYLNDLEGQRFDVVVIDEASMVSTDLAVIAAGLSAGHVVVAGDFRQLGPIALSQSPDAAAWLRRSVFEASSLATRVTRGEHLPDLVALRTQHRMRPAIERVIARGFYGEVGLQTGASVLERRQALPVVGAAELTLVNTSSLRPWLARRNGRHSKYNVLHAQVVDALARSARPDASLGAVSPFAPQATLLRALIEQPDTAWAAATVHRFQGGERDVMIWDMTEGRAGMTKINPWFMAMQPHEEGARLANVALSRARDQLFIIADVERVNTLPEHTLIRRTLHVVQEYGGELDARELLLSNPGRTTLRTGADPCHPLSKVLETADGWLTIWSSAPPLRLDSQTLSILESAARAGTAIYVRTGVPSSESSWTALRQLQAAGCSVQLVRPCWENVAFTTSSVITSPGSLLTFGSAQVWVETKDAGFAGVVARLIRRLGDRDPSSKDSDRTCDRGHPLLVDKGHDQEFRGRCIQCQGDVTPTIRNGRTRAKFAAVQTPKCPACGERWGLDGRCAC